MQGPVRRFAFSDPHYAPPASTSRLGSYSLDQVAPDAVAPVAGPSSNSSSFLIANSGQTNGDLRWNEYDIKNGTFRTKAILTDLSPFRTACWSKTPTHDCLIACGTSSGRITLYDLDSLSHPSSQPSFTHPSQPRSHHPHRHHTQSNPGTASSIAALAVKHTRPCMCLAWFWPGRPASAVESAWAGDLGPDGQDGLSEELPLGERGNPSYLAAGYDKTRSEYSLLIWDVESILQSAARDNADLGYRAKLQSQFITRRPLYDRLSSNIPPPTAKDGSPLPPPVSTASTPTPLQQYLMNECVNSMDTFPHTIHELLASYGSKHIRLIDLRVPTPSAPGGATPGTRTPTARKTGDGDPGQSVSWKANTRAVFNLAVCPSRPYMFASSEEGLGGIVRIWDLRFMPSASGTGASAGASGLAAASGSTAGSVGEVLTIEAGRGGVSSLKWDGGAYLDGRPSPSTSRLGVGTQNGGVLLWDMVSSGPQHPAEAREKGESSWSVLTGVKGSDPGPPAFPLQSFAFLPSDKPTYQNVVSSYRDGNITYSRVGSAAVVASGQLGDMSVASSGAPLAVDLSAPEPDLPHPSAPARGRMPPPPKGKSEDTSGVAWRHSGYAPPLSGPVPAGPKTWSGMLSGDVGLAMRAKAQAGFGLNLLANDAVETRYPTTDGFLWEWFDRFVKLMGKTGVSGMEDYDFALQGICGIWNAAPVREKEDAMSYKSGSLLIPRHYESETSDWSSVRTPTNRSPASGKQRILDRTEDADYAKAIWTLMEQRRSQFLDTVITVDSARLPHRRFMLAICGELSGSRLDVEIDRIAETNLTKAACLAYLNRQTSRAVSMLHESADEKHRLVGTLLLQRRLDPAAVAKMNLQDPYLRAMVKSLAGDTSWGEIVEDSDLPLLERLVLALRFVGDDALTIYLERMANSCMDNHSLHGMVLIGLTGRGLELVSRYVDRTGDLQSAAIIAAFLHKKPARAHRWIQQYRDLLDSWKLYSARIAFDVAHGQITKANGAALRVPPQIQLRCNYCQKVITGQTRSQSLHAKVRASCCQNCGNRLPRCCICLLHVEAPVGDSDTSPSHLESATLFCQTCHHGGHYQHIMQWFYGDSEDDEGHSVCAVSGCDCNCASL